MANKLRIEKNHVWTSMVYINQQKKGCISKSSIYIRTQSLSLIFICAMWAALPQTALCQAKSITDAVNRVILHIEGTPPVWESPAAKTSIMALMNDNELKEFIKTLKRFKTWIDDQHLSKLDNYISELNGIEDSLGIAPMLADMKVLRELSASQLSSYSNEPLASTVSTRSVKANFSHSFILSSTLGNSVADATITVRPRNLSGNRGRAREYVATVLTHQDGGTYVFSAPADVSVDYDVEIVAKGHVSKSIKLPMLQGRSNIALIHEDYVARCNDIKKVWEGCSVDPDRLIETFGIVDQTLMNSEKQGKNPLTLNVQLHTYLPQITNDGIDFLSRKDAYYKTLSLHSKMYTLGVTDAVTRAVTALLEDDFKFDTDAIYSTLTTHGLGMLVPVVDEIFVDISNSGASPETIDSNMGENIQAVFLFASYQTSHNLYFAILRERMKSTWIARDKAFIAALEQVESEFSKRVAGVHFDFAGSFKNKNTKTVVFDLFVGDSVELKANQLNNMRGLMANSKLMTSSMIHDLIKTSSNPNTLKSLLMVMAQIDREFFIKVPDDNAAIRSGLETSTLHLMAMRSSLGLLYNEVRVVLLNGDNMRWVRNSWQYSWTEAKTESQAYDMAMTKTSIEKIESASNNMRQVLNMIAVPKLVTVETSD